MSVMEEIRKLDEQKAKLLSEAKSAALSKAEEALAELKELGFNYSLTEGSGTSSGGGKRRTGVRQEVLEKLRGKHPTPRAEILEMMGVKGDKSGEQSVSNALSALKRSGELLLTDDGYVHPSKGGGATGNPIR